MRTMSPLMLLLHTIYVHAADVNADTLLAPPSNPTEACTPYTPVKTCGKGQCYNAGTCACVRHTIAYCQVDPCLYAACRKGYECRANYCGGCNYQCVVKPTPAPTPVPTPAPTPEPTEACTPYTPVKACGKGQCYNAGTCVCVKHTIAYCLVNPCLYSSCNKGYECRANYCGGCNYQCVVKPTPAPTPAPTPEPTEACTPYTPVKKCEKGECYNSATCHCAKEYPVRCSFDPCLYATCRKGYECRANYCGGCNYQCVVKPTPVPTPAPTPEPTEACTPYTPVKKCEKGECYNPATCHCAKDYPVRCLVNPCMHATCRKGYECRANYCGGCNYQCVSKPTPTPKVRGEASAELCTPYTPPTKCDKRQCYNAKKCGCQRFDLVFCAVNPCMHSSCKKGYKCVANYCGGCNYQCVL